MTLRIDATTTLAQARAVIANLLRERGVADADREATLLIARAGGLREVVFHVAPDTPLGAAADRVAAFAARRLAGEPLSRIEGRREFWSLDFAISPDVLDPRADTETLVEAAIAILREDWPASQQESTLDPLRILDFGAGSGAILCALLTEFPAATGLGIDVSDKAVAVARANIEALGLGARATVRVGDWGAGLGERFDLIVSNPPYIPSQDIAALDFEVRGHDPQLALDGGPDGLSAYRALAPMIARLLAPNGRFALEIGSGQVAEVTAILAASGLSVSEVRRDFAGVERVVAGTQPSECRRIT